MTGEEEQSTHRPNWPVVRQPLNPGRTLHGLINERSVTTEYIESFEMGAGQPSRPATQERIGQSLKAPVQYTAHQRQSRMLPCWPYT